MDGPKINNIFRTRYPPPPLRVSPVCLPAARYLPPCNFPAASASSISAE